MTGISTAYTAIHWQPPHGDIGPTFRTKESCENWIESVQSQYKPVLVTCWIDDFTSVDHGVLLFRTDCSHELSLVVAEDTTADIEYGHEACVGTRIYSEAEALFHEKWGHGKI